MRPTAPKRPRRKDRSPFEMPLSRWESNAITLVAIGGVVIMMVGAYTIVDTALTWAESFYVGGL